MTYMKRHSQDRANYAVRELREEVKQLRAALHIYEALVERLKPGQTSDPERGWHQPSVESEIGPSIQ